MLAIKDLNNIIWFGKPVPVILNRTAGLGYLCSKGDNPIFRSQNFQMFMIDIWWQLIVKSRVGLIETTHICFRYEQKGLKTKPKIVFKKLKPNRKNEASDSNTISKLDQKGLS